METELGGGAGAIPAPPVHHVTCRGPHSLVSERPSPELCGVGLGDAEVVALEEAVGEDGLELGQHVTEDQRQLGEVPPEGAAEGKYM